MTTAEQLTTIALVNQVVIMSALATLIESDSNIHPLLLDQMESTKRVLQEIRNEA